MVVAAQWAGGMDMVVAHLGDAVAKPGGVLAHLGDTVSAAPSMPRLMKT